MAKIGFSGDEVGVVVASARDRTPHFWLRRCFEQGSALGNGNQLVLLATISPSPYALDVPVTTAIRVGFDYPMIQDTFIFLISTLLLTNFIVDLVYVYIDPRVRTSYVGD